jgi:hypothetical protein
LQQQDDLKDGGSMLVRFTFLPVLLMIPALTNCGRASSENAPSTDTGLPASMLVAPQSPASNLDTPECPDHEFWQLDKQKPPSERIVTLLGDGASVPEFADCQALVKNNVYGPVVAIIGQHKPIPSGPPSQLYLAALIYNFGSLADANAGYSPLKISQRFTCLYLPISGPITTATLLENDHSFEVCKLKIDPIPGGPFLQARVHKRLNSLDKVPRAARWEWDRVAGEQYIGVTCRREWCEIGKPNFHSAPYNSDTLWVKSGSSPVPGKKVGAAHRIPAYFDEQILAEINEGGGPTNPVKLSGARARFYPAPTLGEYEDFLKARYVGTMTIDKRVPKYVKMYGLIPEKATHVYMKRKTDAAGAPIPLNPDGTEPFEAIFETAGSEAKIINYKRWAHPAIYQLAPMVRWRWSWDDETTWVQCTQGCCSTQ